ncbi:MAG: hypothetical protein AMXMBFR36_04150 [Acidobacteriota bacterium]
MPHSLSCGIAVIKDGVSLPTGGIRNGSETPAAPLIDASNQGGGASLAMSIDYPSVSSCLPANHQLESWDLHDYLRRITKNSTYKRPAPRIAVLVADRWPRQPDVMGVMFDAAFSTALTGNSPTYTRVPREGCALFVDAIRDIRPEDDDFERELYWTCVHELSHVFNLWHDASVSNFLASPDRNGPTKAFRFTNEHKRFLADCESSDVYPGGNDFGIRRSGFPGGAPDENDVNSRESRRRLRLRIGVGQPELAFFEPLELDISLVSEAPTARVPARLDPGYSEFAIWVEQPDGTRRRYSPQRRYCGTSAEITLESRRPFRRDISLFLDSEGFTFRMRGEHRVYATFRLPDGSVLRSNSVSVNVRGRYGKSSFAELVQRRLVHPETARFLYHRGGHFPRRVIGGLTDLSRRSRDEVLRSNLIYALGRYQARRSERAQEKQTRRTLRESAIDLLSRSAASARLSEGRLRNAEAALERLR